MENTIKEYLKDNNIKCESITVDYNVTTLWQVRIANYEQLTTKQMNDLGVYSCWGSGDSLVMYCDINKILKNKI